MTKPEGVAAPLEPSPEKFEKANEEAWSLNRYDFAEAYAAAVSKNLQSTIELLDGTVNKLSARIVELEKEITALRETP